MADSCMTLNELARAVAIHLCDGKVPLSEQQSKAAVAAAFGLIQRQMECGGSVALKEFGTFCVYMRPSRQGQNPKTGKPILIPEKRVMRFRPSRKLQQAVNS